MTLEDNPQPTEEVIKPEVTVADTETRGGEQRGLASGIFVARRHSGPLPPREVLEGYDDLSPGSAKRMIDNVVRRSELRTEDDHRSATFRRFLEPFYRILAFSVVVLIIFLGYRLVEQGETVVGFAFVVTAAGTIAASFLVNTRETRRESRLIERLVAFVNSQASGEESDQ